MIIQTLFSNECALFKKACEKYFSHIHGNVLDHKLRFFSLSYYKRLQENRFFCVFKKNADIPNPLEDNNGFSGLLIFDDDLILHYINDELGMSPKNTMQEEHKKHTSPMQKRISQNLFIKMIDFMNCKICEDTHIDTITNNCHYIIEHSVSIEIFGRLYHSYITFPYILKKDENISSKVLEQLTSMIEVSSAPFSIKEHEPLHLDQQIVLPRYMLENMHIVCNNHLLFKGALGKKHAHLAVKITIPS